ncbi:MAG: flagellar assembly peptidoglycan hydrolase FlgJ [Rhodoferax sp.]|nr:flagellar assembly peptidoglycan hydrolase FlgJ [Rhodoferax sp.]
MSYGNSMLPALPSSQGLAADSQSLASLKYSAGSSSPEAIKETAKQFESLFMRELIKSMREAGPKSGMFDSPGGDLATDLLDQQLSVAMSGQAGGLSDVIALQLTRQMGQGKTDAPKAASAATSDSSAAVTKTPRKAYAPTAQQASFVRQHGQIASQIEKTSGIPAGIMLGQAGHETGWGKFEIKHKNGATSHNLFGIKAGANWTGKVAEVTTTEYVNGVAQKRVAKFRAYDSYADSFKDYARLINESPRYAKARAQTASVKDYAMGLQKAGYATDPEYASKLSRAINTTLQLRRVQV